MKPTAAATHRLKIEGLCASVDGKAILNGVDIEVGSGEVHVVMGPNGSGKSTLANVVMGHPAYEVTAGTVQLDDADLLGLPTWQRAQAGVFLAMQHPTEVPGVSTARALSEALSGRAASYDNGDSSAGAASYDNGDSSDGADSEARIRTQLQAEAATVGLKAELIERPLNVDMSGGEKKRNETVQLAVLQPRIAILDELDSGLDIDALRACANRVEELSNQGMGVLAITHFDRVLQHLHPDRIHVIIDGQIVDSGGPELAAKLEAEGYAPYIKSEPAGGVAVSIGGSLGASLDEQLGI